MSESKKPAAEKDGGILREMDRIAMQMGLLKSPEDYLIENEAPAPVIDAFLEKHYEALVKAIAKATGASEEEIADKDRRTPEQERVMMELSGRQTIARLNKYIASDYIAAHKLLEAHAKAKLGDQAKPYLAIDEEANSGLAFWEPLPVINRLIRYFFAKNKGIDPRESGGIDRNKEAELTGLFDRYIAYYEAHAPASHDESLIAFITLEAHGGKDAPLIISTVFQQKDFFNMPDSPASDLIFEVLEAGANMADLPARKRQVSNGATIEVLENGKQRQVVLKSRKASVTIELADIDKLTGSNKPVKKLFVLALIKANEQAIHEGQLTKDYVSFPLQELVSMGFYSAVQSARTGFKTGMDTLTSLKLKGHIQQSKKKGSTIDALEVLFTGARIERGQCTIFFNERIDWSFIAQYFTILPRYYFRLPNRASDLLYYIFFLARQNTAKIERQGYFTIGFRAIQHRLQLPSENSTKNPQRDIKDPLDEAIERIETEHSNLYDNEEFSLLPVYDEAASISDYLDSGYLKIELKGAFADAFIAISKDTAKHIEAAKKRQARIMEKAVAINAAKNLEAGEEHSAR